MKADGYKSSTRWKLRGTVALGGAASLLVLGFACASRPPAVLAPAPVAPAAAVETSLFLIGDAGEPAPAGEPVLAALGRTLTAAAGNKVVVFLGDNVYPRGVPDSAAPDRAEAERRLVAQMEVARDAVARVYFIPGNHDWAKLGMDGWAAIRREQQVIESRGWAGTTLVPSAGCPGPVAEPVGERLLLVFLDTQWWLHTGPKPMHPTSSCPADSEQEVTDSLYAMLARAGSRSVVVAGHHPLASAGPHGGFFTWKDHIFPLRKAAEWIWLPLPVVGSLYPLFRMAGQIPQDLSHADYQRMLTALGAALTPARPLVYAAGHEHALQVLTGRPVEYVLVSGGGYYGHANPVTWRDETLFARQAKGFMRLEVLQDGRVRLGVIEVNADGVGSEVYSKWLKE